MIIPDKIKPVIRFIITVIASERDSNGNTYLQASIRSTITGQVISIKDTGGATNLRQMVGDAIGEYACYPTVMTIEQTLPKREWQALARSNAGGFLEQDVGPDMIRRLEMP